MIIYFTGTGNSKYLAELFAKQLDDEVTDATQLMKAGKCPEFASEKPYVFVCPVYAWRIPRVFEKWIKECKFSGDKTAYFIIDCGGEIHGAGKYVKKLCQNIGFIYMGTAEVVMPENYLIMFTPTEKQEDESIINSATNKAFELCKKIAERTVFDDIKISFIGHLCSGIVNSCFYTFTVKTKKFYATDMCISCEKCVDNCMLNNITLKDGKPVWGKNCTHCLACICKCPTESIEYGRRTKGLRRYVFSEKD